MADDQPVISVEEIKQALMGTYPPADFVHIHEAPIQADRGGRKLDVLIINCWKSRGYERIGIEIKRSLADFRSELATPEKADWWVAHTHQFFVAVPQKLGHRIMLDQLLPSTWGLLSISDTGRVKQIAAAPKRKSPEDIPWTTTIGLLRSAGGTGAVALQRAFDNGLATAKKQAVAIPEGTTYDDELTRLKQQAERATAAVDRFEKLSGIRINAWAPESSAEELRAATKLLSRLRHNPRWLDDFRKLLQHHLDEMDALGVALRTRPPVDE